MKAQKTNHFSFDQNIDFQQILTNPILVPDFPGPSIRDTTFTESISLYSP